MQYKLNILLIYCIIFTPSVCSSLRFLFIHIFIANNYFSMIISSNSKRPFFHYYMKALEMIPMWLGAFFPQPFCLSLCTHRQNQILWDFLFFHSSVLWKKGWWRSSALFLWPCKWKRKSASDCVHCIAAAPHVWTPAGYSEKFMV